VSIEVREAHDGDLAAMAAIYDHAIVHSDAIWLDEPLGVDGFAQAIAPHREAGQPVLVAVDADQPDAPLLGYGSLGPFRSLAGYAATVEHSVFVAEHHRGSGVGQVLLDALIARARLDGRRTMVAAIDAGNVGSIRFHERNGFTEVGRMPGVGTKRGRPVDLVLLQRQLDDASGRPAAAARPTSGAAAP
jgi:phosphinothricin acetyltransferase